MIQLGQYPAPSHVVAHFSDTHLLAAGRELYGVVPQVAHLELALRQLEQSTVRPQAIVFTGDLADLGEPDAYRRLRDMVEPVAERIGTQIIWVMGNHDERVEYSRVLFDEPGSDAPHDRVYDLDGLRVISFDTTVPGYHHGEVTDEQLAWLADELATPAPHGTLLAVHHPPIPTPLLEAMGMLELQDQPRLAEVLRGSDVRGILGGHLHYSTHSMFAGIPVSVASSTCYAQDLTVPVGGTRPQDGAQAFNLVHVYEDRVVHSTVPVGEPMEVSGYPFAAWQAIAAMTPEQRREAFSSKTSTFNMDEAGRSD